MANFRDFLFGHLGEQCMYLPGQSGVVLAFTPATVPDYAEEWRLLEVADDFVVVGLEKEARLADQSVAIYRPGDRVAIPISRIIAFVLPEAKV